MTPAPLMAPATSPNSSLRRRAFWRALPWTAGAVIVYAAQMATSILMGGEWSTSLVVLQAIVVAVFVGIFYALALAKEHERMETT